MSLEVEDIATMIEETAEGDSDAIKKIIKKVSLLDDPIDQSIYRDKMAEKKLLSKGAFDKALKENKRAVIKTDTSLVGWDGEKGVFCENNKTKTRFYKKSDYIQTLVSRHGMPEDTAKGSLRCVPEVDVIYRPGGKETGIEMNTWKGVDYKENGKGWKLIDKVLDNLFHMQPEDKGPFIKWLAYIVQEHKKTGIAWGFFGEQGTGKGLIVSVIEILLGPRNCALNVSDDDLKSSFNGHIMWEKEFVHLNEIASDYHGRHGVAGKLKALVTDPVIQINIKNIKQFSADNYVNVILHSNKSNPIELEEGDRRWNIVECNIKLNSCAWWTTESHLEIYDQAHNFGAYLMSLDVKQSEACTLRPVSEAKKKVQEQTIAHHVQLAIFINKKDVQGIIKFLHLEDDFSHPRKKHLREASKSGWWSNTLLQKLYRLATEDDNASVKKMANRLTPNLKDGQYIQRRIKGNRERGWLQNGKK